MPSLADKVLKRIYGNGLQAVLSSRLPNHKDDLNSLLTVGLSVVRNNRTSIAKGIRSVGIKQQQDQDLQSWGESGAVLSV